MPKADYKLGHAEKIDQTEFLVPVLVTGTKYVRVIAPDFKSAAAEAEEKIGRDNQYSSDRLTDMKVLALKPDLMLAPEERAAWPYWGYGWYGTDGCDWRSYRTNKGITGIPDIAEESWPIAPFTEN